MCYPSGIAASSWEENIRQVYRHFIGYLKELVATASSTTGPEFSGEVTGDRLRRVK